MRTLLFNVLKSATALSLDLYTSFVGFGYLIGYLTGAVGEHGIHLSNLSVSALFMAMAAYFAYFTWRGEGTPWQRVVGVRPAPVVETGPVADQGR